MIRAAVLLTGAVAAVAMAGCGDAKHEPVKVIASPRPSPPAPLSPPAPPPPAETVAAIAPPAASASPAAATRRVAAASVPVLPGFNDRPPRFIQAGEPTGNDAFRRAFADRTASRPR